MKDFVDRHRNAMATTESFFQVAEEHFARSPIGQKYGVKDLNWSLEEWFMQPDVRATTSNTSWSRKGQLGRDWTVAIAFVRPQFGNKVRRNTGLCSQEVLRPRLDQSQASVMQTDSSVRPI
jgi:hypothetical protein